jgi:pimeloyl-ACP methyl ester carboxylesterase
MRDSFVYYRCEIESNLAAGATAAAANLLEVPMRSSFGASAGSLLVAFSQTDFTQDLKKISVPTLVMHGDDDQIVPYADSGPLTAKLLKNGTLKTYKGFPHGMPTTEAATINADLLTFIKS